MTNNIIDLLSMIDENDLLQWRETLSHCADSIQSELEWASDEFTQEDLSFDLESVVTLKAFLQTLSNCLKEC